MRLATVLTPISDKNAHLAAQCGVTDVVDRYPGPTLDDVLRAKSRIEAYGLSLTVIEGYLPIEKIKMGRDDGQELEALKTLIVHMGKAGIPILCYNFMAGTDWVRTKLDAQERGGALVTTFDLKEVEQAVLLGHDSGNSDFQRNEDDVTEEQLWDRLEKMLVELVPVAEEAGVTLAMHPDDPPLLELLGKARIMNSVENFERLVELVPSSANAICFCQGTFAAMGADILDVISRLGRHIKYVHFRDVRGTTESFVETFHDNGPTDMAAAIRALQEVGFNGPIRPDHVPQLFGEENGEPGYTMLGRLFAYGFIRGLLQATNQKSSNQTS
ncbi:mannonate dehydratase [Planctomycetaceae bacterium]|nr:mannonate dehydratase [Planctomycetaceae bacterium]